MWNAINFTSGYSQVSGLFVSTNNDVYGSTINPGHIYAWHNGNCTPFLMINGTINSATDVFVSGVGDIYASSDNDQGVYRWLSKWDKALKW